MEILTHSFREINLVSELRIKSKTKTVMSWSLQKKKSAFL